MTLKPGSGWRVYIGSDLIGEMNQMDPRFTVKTEETASFGDTAEEPLPSVFSGQFTVRGKFSPEDTGQTAVLAVLNTPAKIAAMTIIASGTKGSGSAVGWSGAAVLTEVSPSPKWDTPAADVSYSFATHGAWPFATNL